MKKKLLNNKMIIAFAISMTLFVLAPAVLAEDQITVGDDAPTTSKIVPRQDIKSKIEAKRLERATKLADNKLRVCKKREKAIGNIMLRVGDRGTKQLATFTKISERVQAFYKDKGLMLDDYDSLVSEVNIKKIAAESAIENTKSSIPTFKCDGADPKGTAESFKQVSIVERQSLKEYKTAIKNLIVAVKSVALSDDNKGDQ